jgi:hypothetical protein
MEPTQPPAPQKPRKDPVTESMPKEWTAEQQVIAKDIMTTLQKHYPGWLWGLEIDQTWDKKLNAFIIRIQDIPSETVYVLNAKDIDRDRMHCAVIAGGMLLEAHGLSRTKWRHDEVHGLKTTSSGIIVPDYAAVPETNPGFEKIKKQFNRLR